jgi:pyridoxamine 5'-phosphate oxidase
VAVRFVLLKRVDERGFAFYTNYESRKARELSENPRAALAFHWSSIGVQVRVEGACERLPREDAEAYFATRPRASQLGAWASRQSTPIASRAELEAQLEALDAQYRDRPIPCPPFWGGFLIVPEQIEFWHDRPGRLHHRDLYTRASPSSPWTSTLLSP